MRNAVIIDSNHCPGSGDRIAERLLALLQQSPSVGACRIELVRPDAGLFDRGSADTAIYFPLLTEGKRQRPDLAEANEVLAECARANVAKVVVISSAMVYGPKPQNPGFISESRPHSQNGRDWYGEMNSIAGAWIALEALAAEHLDWDGGKALTLLRPTPVLRRCGADYFSRLFSGRLAVTLPGHDPSLQLLDPVDLARAICCAVEGNSSGIYNVAADGVIPLRAALRLGGGRRVPLARWLQRLVRSPLAADQLEYVRYSWTVSNARIRDELGFAPARTTTEALLDFLGDRVPETRRAAEAFDAFGMDRDYIAAHGRTLFRFLQRYYWRIEVRGLEHVPRRGRAVLAGTHRGFMPWDAVMTFHLVVQGTARYPRFLIHPTLVKFPFQFNFMTKLGGIIASRGNADRVLGEDELLGFYPEGIHGAFTFYREAYGLGKFGRNEFVRAALRNGAPIVPFVTVGSPEIFPIVGKINWHWWKRLTQWPFFPLAPPFPLLPLPLLSKWHTQFLEPLHLAEKYPPETADDREVVNAISQEVRDRMQAAVEAMLKRRKSIFFGSVFEGEPA